MKRFSFLILVLFFNSISLFCQAEFSSIEVTCGVINNIPTNKKINALNRVNQHILDGFGFQSSAIVYFRLNNRLNIGTGFSIMKDNYLFSVDNLLLQTDIDNGTISTVDNETSSFYIGVPVLVKIDLNPQKTLSLCSNIKYLRSFLDSNDISTTGGANLDPGFNDGLETKFPTQNISLGLHAQYLIPITEILNFSISAGADLLLRKNINILYDSTSQNLILGVYLGVNYKI